MALRTGTARCMLCGDACIYILAVKSSLPSLQDVPGMMANTETRAGTTLPKIGEGFALGLESPVLGAFEAFHLYIT